MSVVINTNIAATVASNNLATSSAMLQKSLARLSSGSKIVNPGDDAGGLAVSMKLSAASGRMTAVGANITDAISLLQTQDGALKVSGEVLNRISELKTLYSDVTKSASDKLNYDAEFNALQAQLTANTTGTFNGVSLFGTGSIGSVAVTEDGGTTVALASTDLAGTSGVGALTSTAVTSLGNTTITIAVIASAIQNVATMRATNGSEQTRFGFATELNTVNKTNTDAATSQISDVDVAAESTALARWNILIQAGTSMLAQANASSNIALKLLQ
jgi:flagellin